MKEQSQDSLQEVQINASEMDNRDDELYKTRHSLAHILAMAIQELRPGTKLGFGPPISDGFYYDFILPTPITDADFPEIEKKMRQIMGKGLTFNRESLPKEAAFKQIESMGEPFKREYAEELCNKKNLGELSFFRTGDFIDMCEGPHVEKSNKIRPDCFRIRSVAGAYWRGNSDNAMMTRIYAWAFKTKEELEAHIKAYEFALARDHKKLGKELDFFIIDEDIGKGLPLLLPNGGVVREELEKMMKELEFKAGFHRVATPHLARTALYYKTGHLPYYQHGMYPFMELKETTADGKTEIKDSYVLRPMNCPHHHKIFAARPKSYRDLPFRLAETGVVYRYEDSGALSGLLRVRSISQNDAHIYCTDEQIKTEFASVIKMHETVYKILGIKDYYMRFSTWNPEDPKGKEKFVDNPKAWEYTQAKIAEVLHEGSHRYVPGPGEAAFYGPKIDFQFKTVTGREESMSTSQLDFAVPGRMGLTYTGSDNQDHTPYVIHRAPLGAYERSTAFMIEHFGAAFPTWLAPVQVHVITVNEAFNEYALRLVEDLRNHFVRIELDQTTETLNKKIRLAVTHKIPNVIVIGEREVQNQTVTLRRYGSQAQTSMTFDAFKEDVLKRIRERTLDTVNV